MIEQQCDRTVITVPTIEPTSWVILHLGDGSREREDNIILQALFDGIFFAGEKKVASLVLLYIADFFV